MRIEEHPFYVLGITARSSRREILERADALSTQTDSDKVHACRILVTHPAKRLDAELSWFPGVAPARIRNIIASIRTDTNLAALLGEKSSGVNCLGTLNAIAYWLNAHDDVGREHWDLALRHLVENSLAIDAVELMATLNADRSVAGIPQITELSSIKSSLTRLRKSTADSLAEMLTRCSRHASILARAVEREVDDGECHVSDFMASIVDRYQILVQPALDRIDERLGARGEIVLLRAENLTLDHASAQAARLSTAIDDLDEELSEWRTVARPIQLLLKSQGLKDNRSIEIAKRVRSISVKVANDFDMHEQARQITNLLFETFQNVPEIAELLEQDLSILDRIIGSNPDGNVCEEEQQAEFDFDVEDRASSASAEAPPPDSGSHADDHSVSDGPYAPDAESKSRGVPTDSDGSRSAAAFVQLCRSIASDCWQGVDARNSHKGKNLSLFRAAYTNYKRQVSPWLAIIGDAYRSETPVIMEVRNAAADCLNSLARGFIWVGEFDLAESLCLEALPLVFDDQKLESAIESQLDFIASEKQKLQRPPSSASKKNAVSRAPNSRGPQSPTQPLFSSLRNSPRWSRVVTIGIATLIGIPLLILSFGPQWQPKVTGTGPSGRERTPVALPSAPPHDPVSLPNGTNLMRPVRTAGLGTLKISNYTDHDAAVKLKMLNGRTNRFVYVRAMSDVTISKISPGEYNLQFASGRDWDRTAFAFREDRSFAAFDEPLSFSEDGRFYSVYEITLHVVPNGNIRKTAISAQEFADYPVGGGK